MAGLGSLLDKTNRLKDLVALLAEHLCLQDADRATAERAAHLCKADLITEMVQDFASLQGLMGGVYASLQGETDAVAAAIREHYRPASAEDALPSTVPGAVLSLADKTDNLAACFSQGLVPGGTHRNRDFRTNMVEISEKIPAYLVDILFDPQTSGGLLISLPEENACELIDKMHEEGIDDADIIGEVSEEPRGKIVVR